MGSVLQFAAFLSICWLFRGAVTHENKILTNKHSNRNGPGTEDFYFDEQKANDDNVKTGRTIPQSAWAKEDKEQTQTVENKASAQFSNEFSFKNALSYFLNMLQELKKDILGLKEIASFKNTKKLRNSQNNSEDNEKPNKMEKNNGTPKPATSTKNTEFRNKNQKPKSNYITDYYQKNGIKFVDDDLETSSDESDDSFHKPNEGASIHELSKNEDDKCIFECAERQRKLGKYSLGAEETTAIPISQTKVLEKSDKEFDSTRNREKGDNFKESTRKPSKWKKSNSKTSREETENTAISKMGRCVKKNNDNSDNLNEKNEHTKKPLKSAEFVTRNPQNENFNKEKSERPNQNKSTDYLSKKTSTLPDSRNGKKSKNEDGSDFDSISGMGQSTTLSSQSSKDVIYPENIENEQDASGMSSKKPIYTKQQEQTTSLKPDDQEQAQNNARSLKNNHRSTVSLQPQDVGSEIPNHEMSTGIEIKDNPKENKDKRLDINSSDTTVHYNKNEPNSKAGGQQNSNSFDTSNTISPTNSGNIMNTDNLNKDSSDNLNGTKGNKKSSTSQQGKNYSETKRDVETKQTKPNQLNNDSKPEITFKDNKLNDSNRGNNNKEKDDNLATMATNDLPPPQDSNNEIQKHDVEESDKPQEEQKNNESLNKRDGILESSPDQEYDFEEDEDFDISDEETDLEMDGDFNQKQEVEFITNDRNAMNDDEILNDTDTDAVNTETVSRDESQIYRHTGYVMEGKSKEQYNTFLEYLYKHSNNSLFESLKNQSKEFSR